MILRALVASAAMLAVAGGCTESPVQVTPTAFVPLSDNFHGPDELILSEFNHPDTVAQRDDNWDVTSGSLYRSNDTGWTGRLDKRSKMATDSQVFRMVSVRRDFGDVTMSLRLRVNDMVESNGTPAQDFDGAHIWLRYTGETSLYAISVDRRDGAMVIKKKCVGGTDNGGTYYDLVPLNTDNPIRMGQWESIVATVRNMPDGTVKVTGDRDGTHVEAVDSGQGCAPITGTGGVGIRGDNAELQFTDIEVGQ